jgi:hypothetical protein
MSQTRPLSVKHCEEESRNYVESNTAEAKPENITSYLLINLLSDSKMLKKSIKTDPQIKFKHYWNNLEIQWL